MSLCIVPLVVANLIEEEEIAFVMEKLRNDLITSLQVLGEFPGLLAPPQCVVSAANKAATKAILFLSGGNIGKACSDVINMKDMPINCCKLIKFCSVKLKLNQYVCQIVIICFKINVS